MSEKLKVNPTIETGKVKLPVKTTYEHINKDIFDIFNQDKFPEFVFRWVLEKNFSDHKERGWEFVDPKMGVSTRNGVENALNRIQFREFTLMFHWKTYIEDRDKKIRARAEQRVSDAKNIDKIMAKMDKE